MLRLLILLAGAGALATFTGCQSSPYKSGRGDSADHPILGKAQRRFCDCGNDYNPLDPYCRCGNINAPPPIISSIPVGPVPVRGTPIGVSVPGAPLIGTPLPTSVPIAGPPITNETIKESPKEK